METLLLVLDLLGTFVFALSGATAVVGHRLDLFGVLVLSYAAGNAGGMTRNLLIAALAGAAMVVIGAALQLPSTATTIAGAVLCFGLRFLAIRSGWHLPVADGPEQPTTQVRTPNDRKDDGAMRT